MIWMYKCRHYRYTCENCFAEKEPFTRDYQRYSNEANQAMRI